jgi:hypothetical protein
MRLHTKLVFFFKKIYKQATRKFFFFQIYFTNSVFFLLFGFLTGNLFGSLLNVFQESIIWHGFITIFIIFLVEITNYLIYRQPFAIQNKDKQLKSQAVYKIKRKIKEKKIRLLNFNRIKDSLNDKIKGDNIKMLLYYRNKRFKFPFKKKKKNMLFSRQISQFNTKLQKKKNKIFSLGPPDQKKFYFFFQHKFCFAIPTFAKNFWSNTRSGLIIKSLNLFKIGVLLGFFIDAFKVGS